MEVPLVELQSSKVKPGDRVAQGGMVVTINEVSGEIPRKLQL